MKCHCLQLLTWIHAGNHSVHKHRHKVTLVPIAAVQQRTLTAGQRHPKDRTSGLSVFLSISQRWRSFQNIAFMIHQPYLSWNRLCVLKANLNLKHENILLMCIYFHQIFLFNPKTLALSLSRNSPCNCL